MNWDRRQARFSLILFLIIVAAGLVKTCLTRPIYPDLTVIRRQWPPEGCLLDATALKNRALVAFPRSTTIAMAIRKMGLDFDPRGSGFCLPRAGVLYREGSGWRVRSMTQLERWVWRVPMNIYYCKPEDLARISGIGPSLGMKIYRFIKEKKCLEFLDDLVEIPGIGSARLEILKEELSLE